ncbi:unnamed protein product [Ilex paraguariensis]|uniref:Trichome birefringence-like C-terminal domain-containing protein n=1 Tax=Ilex paraguariensis TaxID=185542 RepID=A0ABC8RZL9_9AQUA
MYAMKEYNATIDFYWSPLLVESNCDDLVVAGEHDTSEYNATIDFYWSPLLVESNCDDPVNHRVRDRIVRIQAIEKHARHWTDADILVFDSFVWWLESKMTLLSDGIYKHVGMLRRYEMALKTWSDWLDIHVNRTKTQLFFMSLSPSHKLGEDWGMATDQNCYNETEPISEEGYWGSMTDVRMMQIAEAAIQELRTRGLKVQILNITQLSDYRKEAHPSIYRRQWVPLTEEQLSDPRRYADCVHWGKDWGMAADQNCYNETKPISEEGYWGSMTDIRMMQIAEAAVQELRTRGLIVQILNITQLSGYRKEAHPSIYKKQRVPLTEKQLSDPRSYPDCVHWCLPGVPDVWIELLYAYLFN